LADWSLAAKGGIVDQEIDSAKVLKGGIGKRYRRLLFADIAQNGDRLAASCFNLSDHAVSLGLVRPDIDDDGCPRLCERYRDCAADIAAGACNNRDFAGKLLAVGHGSRLPP
jgi:hypothetical protein